MKYRSRTDIAAAILDVAQDGVIKTQMMYKAFLSFPQVHEYLDLLMEEGLIVYIQNENVYRTTEKGMRFLNMYRKVGHMIFPRGSTIGTRVSAGDII